MNPKFRAVLNTFEDEFGIEWHQMIDIFIDEDGRWCLKPYYQGPNGLIRDEIVGGYPSTVLIDNLFSDIKEHHGTSSKRCADG